MVGVLAALAPRPADACSCRSRADIVPAHGAVGVPLNTTIWVGVEPWERERGTEIKARLLCPDGGSVALTLSNSTGGWMTTRPPIPLDPLSPYSVVVTGMIDHTVSGASFTTGGTVDVAAPATPTVSGATRHTSPSGGGTCGRESVNFTVAGLLDDHTPEDDQLLAVYAGPSEDAIDATGPVALVHPGDAALRESNCEMNFPISTTPDVAIRVQAVDWAGNVSELSAPRQLKACGCASVEGPLAASALLLLRALRRRRPRP